VLYSLAVPSLELMAPGYTNMGDDGMMALIQGWPNCDPRGGSEVTTSDPSVTADFHLQWLR
jgi:hypothetical protein